MFKTLYRRLFGSEPPSGASVDKWLLGDVAFTLLPIGIIAAISAFGGRPLSSILLWREWSFGSIVLYGAALSELVEIKSRLQRDMSQRLFSGVRFFILLIVASAIVLTLVVLHEGGLSLNGVALGIAQLLLYLLATAGVLAAIQSREDFMNVRYSDEEESRIGAVDLAIYGLTEVSEHLDRVSRIAIRLSVAGHESVHERDQIALLVRRSELTLKAIQQALVMPKGAG